ncbi:hypothetical protein LIZ13_06495 [Streptococcus oralis]|uniref:hypothetical protein n=1 Tax=Streptococcus oralis TaxID=1303 RepID=UPI001D077706|nr:hypothetical protein [Streptococcus oralis]MCB7107569.1 hypothetical protein [Streptococcus oralis]MCQ5169820.1 hypothetical protein [Streptococcus oralis]
MTKFVQLVPFKYGEMKEPITINIDCIQGVLKNDVYLSKVFVSDEMIEHLKDQLTADEFLYVINPTYEKLVAILTQEEEDK